MKNINNKDDYETQRHNTVLERISLARSVKELPRINFSGLTDFLTKNAYFDKKHLKKSEFKPFIVCLMDNGMLPTKEVTDCFISILKNNYPNHTNEEYMEIYNKIFTSGIINNIIKEMDERTKKIKNIEASLELEKHNDILIAIDKSSTIKELSNIKIPNLITLIKKASKNEVVDNIQKNKLKKLEYLLFNQVENSIIEKEIENICESYNLNCNDFSIMYEQMINIVNNKKIKYAVEELREYDNQVKRIYYQKHLNVLEQISGANELNQLPKDLNETNLVQFIAINANSVTDEIIPTSRFRKLAQILLLTKDINSAAAKQEIKNIAGNSNLYNKLIDRFNSLYQLDYMIEEVALYNKRVNEFTNNSVCELSFYGYRTPNAPKDAGVHYVLINNIVNNLDLNAINHNYTNSKELEETIQLVIPNMKIVGGAILPKRDANLKLFKQQKLLVLKDALIELSEEQLKEVEQEIDNIKKMNHQRKKGNNE